MSGLRTGYLERGNIERSEDARQGGPKDGRPPKIQIFRSPANGRTECGFRPAGSEGHLSPSLILHEVSPYTSSILKEDIDVTSRSTRGPSKQTRQALLLTGPCGF